MPVSDLNARHQEESLVGVYEIAQALDVTPAAVTNWKARDPTFPKPIAKLRMGPVWKWGPVHEWAIVTQSGRRKLKS